jgi:hypothetical protein
MNEITSKIKIQFAGFLCVILVASLLINSGVLGYVSGVTNNPPRNAHAMLFGSNKAARRCDEYSTNLNGIKVSTSLTGKITSSVLELLNYYVSIGL